MHVWGAFLVKPSKIIFPIKDTLPQKEGIILLYIEYHSIPKYNITHLDVHGKCKPSDSPPKRTKFGDLGPLGNSCVFWMRMGNLRASPANGERGPTSGFSFSKWLKE